MMNLQKITQYIESFVEEHTVNGTIAAAMDDTLIYRKGFGIADYKANLPCGLHTQYNHDLKATTSFMNERELLHFDAHFSNIVTDGHRLHFADFGLALCSRFELSKAEREFFDQHQNYDQCYTLTYFLHALIVALFGKDHWEKILKEYATGQSMRTIIPSAAAILTRDAPIAVLMRNFHHKLRTETKTAPYPRPRT